MSIIKKSADYLLKRRVIVPYKNEKGKTYYQHVFLTLIIDFERKKYDISESGQEGTRFRKDKTIQEDIAKAALVKEALLFVKKQLK